MAQIRRKAYGLWAGKQRVENSITIEWMERNDIDERQHDIGQGKGESKLLNA